MGQSKRRLKWRSGAEKACTTTDRDHQGNVFISSDHPSRQNETTGLDHQPKCLAWHGSETRLGSTRYVDAEKFWGTCLRPHYRGTRLRQRDNLQLYCKRLWPEARLLWGSVEGPHEPRHPAWFGGQEIHIQGRS